MTNVAHRVYRTIKFETIVTDDDDSIRDSVTRELEKLENLSINELIKNTEYNIVSDEVDEEYIESWDNEEEDE